jgi:hypothetical protein
MSARLLLPSVLLSVLAAPLARAEKVTLPSGTRIEARVERELRSDTTALGETFESTVTVPIQPALRLAIPADSTLEGRVTVVRHSGASGVIGVHFVRLRTPDGRVYDIDGVLAPTQEGQTVPLVSEKKSAVVLIGDGSSDPGQRASTGVGQSGELPADVADRWSQSGLSPQRAVIAKGAEITVELRQRLTVEETTTITP